MRQKLLERQGGRYREGHLLSKTLSLRYKEVSHSHIRKRQPRSNQFPPFSEYLGPDVPNMEELCVPSEAYIGRSNDLNPISRRKVRRAGHTSDSTEGMR